MSDVGHKLYQLARNKTEDEFNETLWEVITYIVNQEVKIRNEAQEKSWSDAYLDGDFGAIHLCMEGE